MSESSNIPAISDKPPKGRLVPLIVIVFVSAALLYVMFGRGDLVEPTVIDSIPVQEVKEAEVADSAAQTNATVAKLQLPVSRSELQAENTKDPTSVTSSTELDGSNQKFDFLGTREMDPLRIANRDQEMYLKRLKAKKIINVGSKPVQNLDYSADMLNKQVIENLSSALDQKSSFESASEDEQQASNFYSVTNVKREPLEATFLEEMEFTLLESTIIPIVIDQPINTELPGRLRANVARDVWSADGSRILVPAGTRAMGEYTSASQAGQTRIFAIWTRLLDPYGLDVPVASGTSDQLGIAGLDGKTNSHFFKRFGAAALVSIIGGYAQSESKNDHQREAIANDFNEASTLALQRSIDIAPTITKDAAAIASIYVNQDINFYKAYELGLRKKQERTERRAQFVAAEKQRVSAARIAASPVRDITKLKETSKFAHPVPLSLGQLPRSVGAARKVSEDQLASGFKSALRIAERLSKVKIDESTRPNRCNKTFTVTEGKLLSVLVQDFLLDCGFVLDEWLPPKNDLVMDWKFLESADITMPNAASSLADLLKHYSIQLRPDSLGSSHYRVTRYSTTTFSVQKN